MKRIKPGQNVRVKRDITRVEGPYAKAGETGVVEETFPTKLSGSPAERPNWYAKVRMANGTIKTFRLTTLEILA